MLEFIGASLFYTGLWGMTFATVALTFKTADKVRTWLSKR